VAHLHFKRTVYRSGGGKAAQRLEYITRQPERELTAADRQLRYVREGREDLVYERSRNLPVWAENNPHTYFRAAERYERVNGVAFEEWKVTLPHELSHRQNLALTRDLVDAIAGTRLPITYALHDPPTLRGTRQQPHLHLLISARQNDGHTRTPAQHFKRYNRAHPERGGAQKDPTFWHQGAIKAHRILISDVVNVHLEYAGLAARVHPARLAARQVDRTPEPKLLPSESRAYREQGKVSPRVQEVLDLRQARAATGVTAREQAQARRYWEGRKGELGITHTQPMAHKLYAIREARVQRRDHPPEPPVVDLDKRWQPPLIGNHVSQIYHTPAQNSYGNVAPQHQVRFRTEREAQQAGYRRAANDHYGPGTGMARRDRAAPLAGEFQRLMRLMEPEDGRGHGDLNVRLHAEERNRDRGMSW
jgi:hypothetical protein